MFASGSFSNLIGLYDSTSLENTAILQGQQGGITHLLIDEQQNRLFSGARKVCYFIVCVCVCKHFSLSYGAIVTYLYRTMKFCAGICAT